MSSNWWGRSNGESTILCIHCGATILSGNTCNNCIGKIGEKNAESRT